MEGSGKLNHVATWRSELCSKEIAAGHAFEATTGFKTGPLQEQHYSLCWAASTATADGNDERSK